MAKLELRRRWRNLSRMRRLGIQLLLLIPVAWLFLAAFGYPHLTAEWALRDLERQNLLPAGTITGWADVEGLTTYPSAPGYTGYGLRLSGGEERTFRVFCLEYPDGAVRLGVVQHSLLAWDGMDLWEAGDGLSSSALGSKQNICWELEDFGIESMDWSYLLYVDDPAVERVELTMAVTARRIGQNGAVQETKRNLTATEAVPVEGLEGLWTCKAALVPPEWDEVGEGGNSSSWGFWSARALAADGTVLYEELSDQAAEVQAAGA